MRAIADSMLTQQSRDAFVDIAEQYERMAQSAQSTWDVEQATKELLGQNALFDHCDTRDSAQ